VTVPDIRIQQAVSGDIAELVSLENVSFVSSDGLLNRRTFGYHIKRGNLLLTARNTKTGELAGYILVFLREKSARAYSLSTATRFRNQGIARTLFENAISECKDRGIRTIRLEVRKENIGAQKLYQSMGFKLSKALPDYYGEGQDGIRMELIRK